MPESKVAVLPREGCVDITSYSKRWPELFPQHGPGRKHERGIALTDWQRQLVDAEPRAFLRGLIHSDGCRIIARQRGHEVVYEYARYSFSNRSDDIRNMLCGYLDRLGIAWNQPNDVQIQISRREAVAALDEFIGPKV